MQKWITHFRNSNTQANTHATHTHTHTTQNTHIKHTQNAHRKCWEVTHVIIGAPNVGKTHLFHRFAGDDHMFNNSNNNLQQKTQQKTQKTNEKNNDNTLSLDKLKILDPNSACLNDRIEQLPSVRTVYSNNDNDNDIDNIDECDHSIVESLSNNNLYSVRRIDKSNRFGPTIGTDYRTRYLNISGVQVLICLWDTAGQEKYESVTNQHFRKADIVWIVIDMNSPRYLLSFFFIFGLFCFVLFCFDLICFVLV